jgi:hypothetical protein
LNTGFAKTGTVPRLSLSTRRWETMGNGQDIYPADLRKLANALLEVAEAAEQLKLGKHEQWKSGVIELE